MTFDRSRFHRIGTTIAFVAAGLLVLAGMITAPWEGDATEAAYLESLVADPAQAQLSALLLHFGYLAMAPALLGATALMRRRAPATGHVLAVFASLGFATLSGFLITDWYALAMADAVSVEEGVIVSDRLDAYPLLALMAIPAFAGAVVGTMAVAWLLWLNRAVAIWVPIAMSGSLVLLNLGIPTLLVHGTGGALFCIGAVGTGIRVLRSGDDAWGAQDPTARSSPGQRRPPAAGTIPRS